MPDPSPIRKMLVPRHGTIILAIPGELCDGEMKLMGIGKLHALTTHRVGLVASAALSLRAELALADWKHATDASKTFPTARIDRHRLTISLPADHCVVIAINYTASVGLIEFAGHRDSCPPLPPAKPRKRS